MTYRLGHFLSRFSVQQRTLGGFAILLLLMVGLAFFSWGQLARIGDDIRILVVLDDMDAAIASTGERLARLNTLAHSFMRTRTANDITAALAESKAFSESVDGIFAAFGGHPLLVSRRGEIRSLLVRHEKALNAAAVASRSHYDGVMRFLAAGIPIANTVYGMGVSSADADAPAVAQAKMRLQASFSASRAAVTRYIVTLQPADADSAREEMRRFEATVKAQESTGQERFDKFVAYIREKLPTYRREADAIAQAVVAENAAEMEIVQVTREMDWTFNNLKQAFAHLRAETVAGQLADVAALHRMSALAIGVVGLLGVLLAWVIGNSIVRPITQITTAMRRLAAGEVDVEIPALDHQDEIGRMAAATEIFKRNALALQVSESRYRLLFDGMQDACAHFEVILNAQGKAIDALFIEVNVAFEHWIGFTRDVLVGRRLLELLPDVSAERIEAYGQVARTGQTAHFVTASKDLGRYLEISVFRPQENQFACFYKDISERVEAEDALRKSEERLSLVLKGANDGWWDRNLDTGQMYYSPRWWSMFGYQSEEIPISDPLWSVAVHPDDQSRLERVIKEALQSSRNSYEVEFRRRCKDGHYLPIISRGFIQRDAMGRAVRISGTTTDLTERKASEEKIAFLAFHDPLTGLPNRLLAGDRLHQALAYADRERCKAAVMFLDLDNFKLANDSLGHSVGDALLKEVAERLRKNVRETDTISRQGGDEFLILISEITEAESITHCAVKILECLLVPFDIEGYELSTSASIGISVYPDDGRDPETLLKRADTAMYYAKEAGRNTYRFFTAEMNDSADEFLSFRNDLKKAIDRQEFVLHYQPQISLATGRTIGVEALIRWNHPVLGHLAPGRFIPIAEDSGLIVDIGHWVLREACRQAVLWQNAGLQPMTMAVNLSAVQFKRGDLAQSVCEALAESGLDPSCLELEMTESILIHDTDTVLATVHRLKAMGIQLSIDDFGTGYSSLAYLKRFDVDRLKIDQSFIRDIIADANDAAIVRAIVQMARSLGLKTVAEGVETSEMLEAVRLQECDVVQGYHFAKPMPAEQMSDYLRSHQTGV